MTDKHYTPAEVEALLEAATDGPWFRNGMTWCICGDDASVVCKVVPWDTTGCIDEDNANATFIAAAPTLAHQFVEQAKELERIKAAARLPYMQNGTEPDGWVLVRQDRILALDEAIGSDR